MLFIVNLVKTKAVNVVDLLTKIRTLRSSYLHVYSNYFFKLFTTVVQSNNSISALVVCDLFINARICDTFVFIEIFHLPYAFTYSLG